MYTYLQERVHVGNTTYTADNHPNCTKPRNKSSMGVNLYKNDRRPKEKRNNHLLREVRKTALVRSATNACGADGGN